MYVVDCVWGSWTSYHGQCNSNSGTKTRTRTKTVVEKNRGHCSGSSTESIFCNGMGLHIYQCNFKKLKSIISFIDSLKGSVGFIWHIKISFLNCLSKFGVHEKGLKKVHVTT